MKLIVDSGSTKAIWIVVGDNGDIKRFTSHGMNPALLSDTDIFTSIKERIPESVINLNFSEIWFYAAGCRSSREVDAICRALHSVWLYADIFAGSDILGAARAVCGNAPGVAAILGTGSNCAVYNPSDGIIASTPPLGYILGDEGSGADIGKTIVNAALKGIWSNALTTKFLTDCNLTQSEIVNRVYRSPEPNRFLASLAIWAKQNLTEPEVERLIIDRFTAFIVRNIKPLHKAAELPAGFVGSVADAFEPQLRYVCASQGVEVLNIVKSPENGLIHFHTQICVAD